MKFDILSRWGSSIIFSAEIACADDTPSRVKLGLAINEAVKVGTSLSGADLSGANLYNADLSSAYLYGANLAGADMSSANLSGANLYGANLSSADLHGADLSGANLHGANLSGADMSSADLSSAYLYRANLSGADLHGADLSGAKWRDDVVLTRAPLYISNLPYPVTILDAHMQIGCELHRLAEWEQFSDERISNMDGVKARKFWKTFKDVLLSIARADGRDFTDSAFMKLTTINQT